MLDISEVLERVKVAGLSVSVADDDKLQITPYGKLTPELRGLLVQHKPAIIAHLNGWAADTGANPRWRWQVVFSDGSARIAAFTPPASWGEVQEFFPAAITGNKIPDDYKFGGGNGKSE